MKNIIKNILEKFRKKNILFKLIYINIFIFILFNIIDIFYFLNQIETVYIFERFLLPANKEKLVNQAWSLLTYMFMHKDLFHLIFNMIWLYFAGKIFLENLNEKQLLISYFLGGITGGLLFIAAYNYIPVLQNKAINVLALGASASVFAIIIAIATYKPKYNIHLPIIGNIKLKNIAIIYILLDILNIPNGNPGGHIAHLGGAAFGFLYIKQQNKNIYSKNHFIKYLYKINPFKSKNKFKSRSKYQDDYLFNQKENKKNKKIDSILDKIARSGYKSLNEEEKKILFNASKK
tara:strand:+ start:1096 stop:1968 length:873 start_codon:yes stop_codon:yes gene_type:complete